MRAPNAAGREILLMDWQLLMIISFGQGSLEVISRQCGNLLKKNLAEYGENMPIIESPYPGSEDS